MTSVTRPRANRTIGMSAFLAALAALSGLPAPCAEASPSEASRESTNISALSEKLFERARFVDIRISPDGARTAFLTYCALPRTDEIEFTLTLSDNKRPGNVTQLARYALPSSRAMLNQSEPRPSAADFRWSPDGSSIAFVQPSGGGVDLVLWDVRAGASHVIEQGHREIELSEGIVTDGLSFLSRDDAILPPAGVAERALRIKDGYDFSAPFVNPNIATHFNQQAWLFDWGSQKARPTGKVSVVSGAVEPREYPQIAVSNLRPTGTVSIYPQDYVSPDGRAIMHRIYRVSNAQSPQAARNGRSFEFQLAGEGNSPVRVTSEADDVCRMDPVGWSRDSSAFVFLEHCEAETVIVRVDRNGAHHVVLRAPAQLDFGEIGSRHDPATEISADGRFVVLVRTRTFYAADLVLVDLVDGELHVLATPNGEQPASKPITTFVLHVADDVFKARLYLPEHSPGTKVPLVIGLYYSGPGLEASTGDELPILPFVASGVAVMTFDAQDMIDGFGNGDPGWEIARVERPCSVIEKVIEQLVENQTIDPARIGISGLSYGAEIATYCYWKSHKFRAVSSAGAGVSPSWMMLGGQGYATRLEARGLSDQRSDDSVWKAVSVTQNARADLPPLLWQTPDSERYASVEAWYRLRRAGAQVEWWDYPGETHRKLGSADLWLTQQRNYDWFRFWLQDVEDADPTKSEQYVRWRAMRDAWQAAKVHPAPDK